ncbi:MAG: hypothetical protein ACRED5_19640 [Propylenella sp.]
MNLGLRCAISTLVGPAVAGLFLAGCLRPPGLEGTGDPLVITEASPKGAGADSERTRAAAVAEMRAAAASGEPHPTVSQAELAARTEPRSATEVAAIETELALIAERRAASADQREIAALEARARELQRLVAAARVGPLRR